MSQLYFYSVLVINYKFCYHFFLKNLWLTNFTESFVTHLLSFNLIVILFRIFRAKSFKFFSSDRFQLMEVYVHVSSWSHPRGPILSRDRKDRLYAGRSRQVLDCSGGKRSIKPKNAGASLDVLTAVRVCLPWLPL